MAITNSESSSAAASSLQKPTNIAESELPFAQLTEWVRTLNPEQLARKVQSELFTPFIVPVPKGKRARNEGNEEETRGDGEDVTAEVPEESSVTDEIISCSSRRCEFSRAVDLVVSEVSGGLVSQTSNRRLTVVGYDDYTKRYKVFAHEGSASEASRCGVVSGKNVMMDLSGPGIESVRAIEALAPIVHPVTAPSLSSVVLMGLHTCGDLGAAICRLYRDTDAPSMVLVSCCWHALTASGFPLCNMLRNDPQFATNSLSLMLATQPLETFVNSSSEEHFGSSRLLFFRSMFSLIWEDLRVQCSPPHLKDSKRITALNFSKFRPVLDRSFLRSLSKDKKSLTFVQFSQRVRDELMTSDAFTNKIASALCSPIENISVEDVSKIAEMVKGYVSSRYMEVAATLEDRYFERYYPSFVGFTTLRMWLSHLLETLLLMDRLLFLCESAPLRAGTHERLSLVPLFDGHLSPRLFAILALKGKQ
eukprot:GILI01010967.1.p1 GENE.GILI01010967.1~~GILI01010967.1.p1  ORF type:complete len:537 (+),score=85.85 GILI01010967.1:182-1612(+)